MAAHAQDGIVKTALLKDLMRIVSTRFELQRAVAPSPWAFWRATTNPAPEVTATQMAQWAAAERAVAGGFHLIEMPNTLLHGPPNVTAHAARL